jgi:coenzyme F420 biosynthesis associated uncharacterized protein|tara:strand:- start:1495 stop:2598 length:1104 start_codon:yes stop_codon:yes gene_type:complete
VAAGVPSADGSGRPPSAIDWDVAEQVATRVAARAPFGGAHHLDGLVEEFDIHTARAEGLVAETTGLRALHGEARARVVGRDDWIRANLVSLQRLLRPLLDKMVERSSTRSALLAHRVAGVELGVVLGWMSTRVLGQYDLLVLEDEAAEDQDLVYYVGPNLVALERRYAFDPHQFRLWLALHEVTHRTQFTGVPWMREHYLGLVGSLLEDSDVGPTHLVDSLRSLVEGRRNGSDAGGGILTVVASPEQQVALDGIAGLMSLLEGHGDVTMDRAGEGIVVGADRFGRVLRERRRSASGFTRIFQRLVGLEAKLAQYAKGEAFIGKVEEAGGSSLLNRVWEAPANLPDLAEINSPEVWIARMGEVDQLEQ